jgi:hypothetical protein
MADSKQIQAEPKIPKPKFKSKIRVGPALFCAGIVIAGSISVFHDKKPGPDTNRPSAQTIVSSIPGILDGLYAFTGDTKKIVFLGPLEGEAPKAPNIKALGTVTMVRPNGYESFRKYIIPTVNGETTINGLNVKITGLPGTKMVFQVEITDPKNGQKGYCKITEL